MPDPTTPGISRIRHPTLCKGLAKLNPESLVIISLDLRHERNVAERAKQAASRQDVLLHIDFFLLIVSMGQSLASQGEPGAPRAPRSSHSRPDRTSQGKPEAPRASESSQPRRPGQGSRQPGRPGWSPSSQVALNVSPRPARVPDPQAGQLVEQFRYFK